MDRPNGIKNSLTVRLVVIGLLIFVLLIPISFSSLLIFDRQSRREEAARDIGAKWGGGQVIGGPVLTVPYRNIVRDDAGKITSDITQLVHLLPETLNVNGGATLQALRRGIFRVPVYTAHLELNGAFSVANLEALDLAPNQIRWDDAYLTLGISDARGIQEPLQIKWQNVSLPFSPGVKSSDVVAAGVNVKVPLPTAVIASERLTFALTLDVRGTNRLEFMPVGRKTQVTLASDWRNPSFTGAFLPAERSVNDRGFTASWNILEFNRTYPQQWIGKAHTIDDSVFGVTFLIPVDQYAKTNRAVKYAIMFLALTFLIFFFVEIFNKLRIHPFQYLLVGLALALFYTLLLAIAEHLNFDLAYVIAGGATTALIAAYASSMFKNAGLGLALAAALLVMYAFLYVLLQLQDYALLVGSIGLFVILGIVMYVSRKIDWYAFGNKT